jgi:hypothetical protein
MTPSFSRPVAGGVAVMEVVRIEYSVAGNRKPSLGPGGHVRTVAAAHEEERSVYQAGGAAPHVQLGKRRTRGQECPHSDPDLT